MAKGEITPEAFRGFLATASENPDDDSAHTICENIAWVLHTLIQKDALAPVMELLEWADTTAYSAKSVLETTVDGNDTSR
ncbi:hypothetical protein [Candidatus Synchoanobacter obligatus]|uniref:Uncharacterized protein n=1 Tax=Candidatus Synchoanobacter obligatus TaxID=2919597 RepID=A0ABT1L5H0_9GAMM|nr:hypothetical protein [Candidatus Synchoanobacter obligatus]MCP8352339.1 hypothetical protein [Candidatus Synchoanobacter obligatus]